jgi:hypothetical protein
MKTDMVYDGTLEGLFALLERLWNGAGERGPRRAGRPVGAVVSGLPRRGGAQGLLFGDEAPAACGVEGPAPAITEIPGPLPGPGEPGGSAVPGGAAGILFQVSADTYDALVHTWMSGLPVEGEALRYALRVLSAAKEAAPAADPSWYRREEARRAAALAAGNRLDDDCRTVLAVSYKVAHEIDRLMGFLRFSPDDRGRYIARCAPDYFVLPALAAHFAGRFGNTPWAIVDEKRGLVLAGEGGVRLTAAGEAWDRETGSPEPWEDLWRCYHRTVSIEGRKNLSLQRRFIPARYRNYLDEFKDSPACSVETGNSAGPGEGEPGLFTLPDP